MKIRKWNWRQALSYGKQHFLTPLIAVALAAGFFSLGLQWHTKESMGREAITLADHMADRRSAKRVFETLIYGRLQAEDRLVTVGRRSFEVMSWDSEYESVLPPEFNETIGVELTPAEVVALNYLLIAQNPSLKPANGYDYSVQGVQQQMLKTEFASGFTDAKSRRVMDLQAIPALAIFEAQEKTGNVLDPTGVVGAVLLQRSWANTLGKGVAERRKLWFLELGIQVAVLLLLACWASIVVIGGFMKQESLAAPA